MPEFEAIGEAVTGGMLGRAVEPKTGESTDGHTGERNCLNCGAPLTGPYCQECGQRAHVHRTLAAWWHDFLHSVLHVDGKFWLTLKMLSWRPGELTLRYAHGERAKFVSPLALFLFTVFLMFAVMSAFGGSAARYDAAASAEAQEEMRAELAARQQSLERLTRARTETAARGSTTSAIDAQIGELRQEVAAMNAAGTVTGALTGGRQQFTVVGIKTGWAPLDRAIDRANENPSLLLYKIQANAYKFSWALIPISVPFVWVLFLHRRRYRQEFTAYDHLVFVTYSIAFMSLALVVWVLLSLAGAPKDLLDLAFVLIPPIHIYRQLKGAYGLSRMNALWRTAMLLIFATVALTLFGMLLLLVGAFS